MNSDVKDLGVRKQLIFLFFSFIVVACVLSGCSNARGSDSVKESKTEASRGNDPLIGVIIEATGDIVYTEEERQTSLLKLQGNVNQSERAGYSVQPTTEEEVAYVPIDAEPVYTADLLDNYVPILPEPSVQESTIQPVTLNQIPSEPFSEIAKDIGGSGNTDVLKTPDVLPTSSPAPAVDVSKNITPNTPTQKDISDTYDYPESQIEVNTDHSGILVWISDDGKRFHSKSTCSGMRNNVRQVTIEEAKTVYGRTACGKCHPPQ